MIPTSRTITHSCSMSGLNARVPVGKQFIYKVWLHLSIKLLPCCLSSTCEMEVGYECMPYDPCWQVREYQYEYELVQVLIFNHFSQQVNRLLFQATLAFMLLHQTFIAVHTLEMLCIIGQTLHRWKKEIQLDRLGEYLNRIMRHTCIEYIV